MKLQCCLIVLITLTSHLTTEADGDEFRADVCVEACYDAMHWEICAQKNGCYGMNGGQRMMCMEDCLYAGVQCQSRCWDSFHDVMTTCHGQCPRADGANANDAECRRRCFLREYQNLNSH